MLQILLVWELTDEQITRMLQSKLRKDQGKNTKFIANALP